MTRDATETQATQATYRHLAACGLDLPAVGIEPQEFSFSTKAADVKDAAVSVAARSVASLPVRIDHVIYATADLEAAAAQIDAQLGLAAVAGGRHEGLGTHNRIVPLGGGYLELLAVADPDEAARSVFGSAMVAHLQRHGDGLAGWAVAVEDVAEVAARLGTSISTIAREGLRAELAGLAEALREPFLPFFLSRDPGVLDPGAAGEAGGITWIEVAGDATRLEQWLDGAQLPVRTVDGAPRVRAVGIGEGELRTG